MKSIYKTNLHYRLSAGLGILALFVALTPSAAAKHHSVKPRVEAVTVIAHVALLRNPSSRMFLHEHGDRQYLFMGDDSEQDFTLVDVTEPNEPKIIETMAPPQDSSDGKLQMVGGEFTSAEAPAEHSQAVAGSTSNELVSVRDLIEPASLRKIQDFSEIDGIISDDRRHLIYITNSEGLWILMLQPELAAASKRDGCSTEDAFNEFANCQ